MRTSTALLGARLLLALGLSLACGRFSMLPAAHGSELRHTATVKLVKRARPSIVNIHGQKTLGPYDDGFHQGDPPQGVNGMGTGVIIDPRGYIITNHHVVDGVRRISVTLADESAVTATLVSHDPKTDLAIIKIDTAKKLTVITIGTSADLEPGEPVVAVGNAYGYEHTVTRGIISALHRTVQVSDAQSYQDLIQTDASINPGNSGGPLMNIDGEMIGINVAVRAGAQGIGFAIPVDMAMGIAAKLMSVERIGKTWHGVVPPASASAEKKQYVIGEVDQDSPAAKCGLKSGDIVSTVDGATIERALDFERALLGHKAGDEIKLSVERNKRSLSMKMVLAQLPQAEAPVVDRTWEVIGLKLDPISAKQFKQSGTKYRGGLLVTAVRPESPGAQQGIRRGDILVGMHIWETVTLDNVAYILNRPDFSSIEPVKFYIVRGNETLFGHLPVTLLR